MLLDFLFHIQIAALFSALVCPILILAWSKYRKGKLPKLVMFLCGSTVLVTAFLVTPVALIDFHTNQVVEAMDRNGDGFNTKDEAATYTEYEKRAYEVHIGDGGRNVFALFSPIVAVIYSLILSLVFYGGSFIVMALRGHKNEQAA